MLNRDKSRVKIIFTLYFKPLFDAFLYNLASHQDFSLFQGRLEAYVDYDQFYLALKKGSLV